MGKRGYQQALRMQLKFNRGMRMGFDMAPAPQDPRTVVPIPADDRRRLRNARKAER